MPPTDRPMSTTVTEVKDGFLEGYDTWAAAEDVALDALKDGNRKEPWADSRPSRPLLDRRRSLPRPSSTPARREETVELTFLKKWVDYGNALETRPTELTVKLYRKANSQPDQDNAIGEQELPEESYAL